jgi:hypothetical protein
MKSVAAIIVGFVAICQDLVDRQIAELAYRNERIIFRMLHHNRSSPSIGGCARGAMVMADYSSAMQ